MPASALRPIVLFAFAGWLAPLKAQDPDEREGFVVCLGDDTLAVERYRRSPTRLESEIVLRVPTARRVTYSASLAGQGDVQNLELVVEPLLHGAPRPGAPRPEVSRGILRFLGDTAEMLLTLDDSTRLVKVAARPGSMPLTAFSHALVEQAILRAARQGRDSVAFDWVGVGAPVAYPTYVTRRGDGAVTVGFFDAPAVATVDSTGRMLALDGRATTAKVEVHRAALDLEDFARRFAAAEAEHGPAGQLSPRDTAWGRVGPVQVAVDYGRPRRRGRIVFGGVVPWGRVWRTGANAATQFSTDATLLVGGQRVAPGSYSLWTIPRHDGATLILNARTGQWGTHHEPGLDVARVEMRRTTLPEPREQFTVEIEPTEAGGVLRLSWDTTSYTVPLAVAGDP